MKKRLLHVLGGGQWQVPTVRLAKQLGYRVLVTDMFKERPAYAMADSYEIVDIADPKATLDVAKRYLIDGILCDTTDTGVPTAAYVAETMQLPGMGFETALNFTDKWRMRTLTAAAGCYAPDNLLVNSQKEVAEAAGKLDFPVIVKPVDNQSGRGVTVVRDRDKLLSAYYYALRKSRKASVLVESYIRGDEYIVDGFMVDGVAQVLGIALKTPNTENSTVADHITYQPMSKGRLQQKVIDANERAISALGLLNGIFHAEYRVCGEQVFPIDIAARGGGCKIYSHVLPNLSGVHVNREMIKFAMGESFSVLTNANRAANIEFLQLSAGIVESITGIDDARAVPGVITAHINFQFDERKAVLREKDDRPGYLISVADSAEQAKRITADAVSLLKINLRN